MRIVPGSLGECVTSGFTDRATGSKLEEGPEGVKWELGFAHFFAGKMGFMHWDWDSSTKKQ